MGKIGQKGGPGRPKGARNKLPSVARQAFLATFEELEPDIKRWITETAEGFQAIHFLKDGTQIPYLARDPAKAADLLIRMAEYHFPKLARSEVSGPDGDPLTIQIVTLAPREEK